MRKPVVLITGAEGEIGYGLVTRSRAQTGYNSGNEEDSPCIGFVRCDRRRCGDGGSHPRRIHVYVDDKHWGLFILKYTGPDQPAPASR